MSDAQRATQRTWALVLAAGDGNRLRALTTQPCGTPVPKQYCSLHGGPTLLADAIHRARSRIAPERVCAIVAQQHRTWWSALDALTRLPPRNLIVQPRNRGTAIGILYSLVHILSQDPAARVLVLPADHYVADEQTLQRSLANALAHIASSPARPVLLGLHADEPDSEFGYIVPGEPDGLGARDVTRFVEKPGAADAEQIVRAGGLWNTFIMAASARALLSLFLPRFAPTVMEMQVIVSNALQSKAPGAGWPAIVDMYTRLPDLDFSHDVLEGNEASLSVMRVPPCGWSDLGTPHRVAETLRRWPSGIGSAAQSRLSGYINLAAQHAHFERTQTTRPTL